MTTYIAPIGSGIGDVVVCRPVCDWFTAGGGECVYLVARGPRQVGMAKLIEGLAGEIREPELQGVLKQADRYINLRDHPLQRDEDWFSQRFKDRYPNITITEILGKICTDFGITADLNEFKPLACRRDSRASGKVVLVPGTTMKRKMLKTRFWCSLYSALKARSIDAFMLGSLSHSKETRELVERGVPHVVTEEITEAVNLISSAAAVVSVDTGLMHVAVQQNIRTVAIFGDCRLYYRRRKNCLPIFAANQPVPKDDVALLHETAFSAHYDNWQWLPPGHDAGSYLKFDDVEQVLGLLLEAGGKES